MLKFKHPSTWIVAGPSQSGKTHFVSKILTSNLIEPKPDRILYAYSIYQPAYDQLLTHLPFIEFHKGLDVNLLNTFNPNQNNLLIIDDLMRESGDGDLVGDIFTRGSHHLNLSTIFIVQNIFHKCKALRECSLNCHYLVIFKIPRDQTQVRTLGYQMFPAKKNFLPAALEDATSLQDRGYLVIDLRNDTPSDYRVRTCVFPHETTVVYKPP